MLGFFGLVVVVGVWWIGVWGGIECFGCYLRVGGVDYGIGCCVECFFGGGDWCWCELDGGEINVVE